MISTTLFRNPFPLMFSLILAMAFGVHGQEGRSRPGGGPPRGGGGPKELELVKRFDRDADSKLNFKERTAARAHVKEVRAAEKAERGPGRGPRPSASSNRVIKPGKKLAPKDVRQYGTEDLYDATVVRTIFLDFENEDWDVELSDFYRTDVEVPARMIVDGVTYPMVGVKVRGNTSSMFVAEGLKKSLGISVDYDDPDLRLKGYKTLNLLNAHTDPTFMREMLYDVVARNYLPAAKANFVRVVANGENWGIYVNSQQFNKDFLDDWFDTRKGVRWKVPANPREGGGLGYFGDDRKDYEERYELKTGGAGDEAWKDLLALSKTLNTVPLADLERALDPILAIDRTLWFMALDNVLIDNDGYWVRASDFLLFQDKTGRFHPIPHDNNETFQEPRSRELRGRFKGVELDPLFGLGESSKPFMRLLEVPHLKARYLAHVRTLSDEWLKWERLGGLVKHHQDLIAADVRDDTRKLYDFESFVKGVTATVGQGEGGPGGARNIIGLKPFVEQRNAYLMQHAEVSRKAPTISSLSHSINGVPGTPLTTDTVQVVATVTGNVGDVVLYYSSGRTKRFLSVLMTAGRSGVYQAAIPPMPAGTKVLYYVEARSTGTDLAASFLPTGTEFSALSYQVNAPAGTGSPVMISEVMASNGDTLADPQGEYDDWVELRNLTDQVLDLSGMYLSDKEDNPRKWRIPNGTQIPANGYLLIWADEDGKKAGLHANFKLSKGGETVRLHDTDEKKNVVLDTLRFGKLQENQSFGRDSLNQPGKILSEASPGMKNP